MGAREMIRWLEKHYAAITVILSLLVLALNYDATAMQGIVPFYKDFARIIAAGFDPTAGSMKAPTFPIWGYGWIYLIFRFKLVILLFQQALAFAALRSLAREIEKCSEIPRSAVTFFKLLLIVSIPLFALHSVLWPYSIAASLLALSAAFMIRASRAANGHTLRDWVISAAFFGSMLNFRSDFILFPPVIPILVLIVGMDRTALKRSVLWVVCVYAMLIPWAAYTRHAIGHALLTSTNSGQVLFASLGQLPGNKWGITTDDGDPVILATVREKLGDSINSLSYSASRVLRDAAIARVRASPGEYGRKVAHGAFLTFTGGFYPGSFYETKSCLSDCYPGYKAALARLGASEPPSPVAPGSLTRAIIQAGAVIYSRVLLILCFLAAPFAIVLGWKRRSFLLAISSAAVVYQAAITTFTHHLPGYTSNVYLFHLILLSAALGGFVIARREPTGHL